VRSKNPGQRAVCLLLNFDKTRVGPISMTRLSQGSFSVVFISMAGDSLPTIQFVDRTAWMKWLDRHHSTSPGVCVQVAKAGTDIRSVTHPELLEVALCYGWIDGQRRRLDDDYWIQKMTPRRSGSIWSQVNCAKALDLIKRGLMQPAGLAAIDQAKANGRWDAAYEAQGKSTVPPDLQAALDEHPDAARFFASLDSRNRYAILFRLQTAKKPETRLARLNKFVAMLERREKIHETA